MALAAKNALFFVIAAGALFVAIRARHYMAMRAEGHDRYVIMGETSDGRGACRCPDMDMFGFKYSVILALIVLNTFLVMYLIVIKG